MLCSGGSARCSGSACGARPYERAARVDPAETRWLKLADAASAAGAHMRAADALEQVARRRGGHDPKLKQRIEDEQRRAMLPGL